MNATVKTGLIGLGVIALGVGTYYGYRVATKKLEEKDVDKQLNQWKEKLSKKGDMSYEEIRKTIEKLSDKASKLINRLKKEDDKGNADLIKRVAETAQNHIVDLNDLAMNKMMEV